MISDEGLAWDEIIRADFLSILCFSGYLSSTLCDHFMGFPGNDTGDLELSLLVLGGGASGLSHRELLLTGYDDIVAYLLEWSSGLGSSDNAVEVLFAYWWARAREPYQGWPDPYSVPMPPPSLPIEIQVRLAQQERAREIIFLPPSSPIGAPSTVEEEDIVSISSHSSLSQWGGEGSSHDEGFSSCEWDSTSELLAELAP